jgi:hypothetical protein
MLRRFLTERFGSVLVGKSQQWQGELELWFQECPSQHFLLLCALNS